MKEETGKRKKERGNNKARAQDSLQNRKREGALRSHSCHPK